MRIGLKRTKRGEKKRNPQSGDEIAILSQK